jgi:hypothetical protein
MASETSGDGGRPVRVDSCNGDAKWVLSNCAFGLRWPRGRESTLENNMEARSSEMRKNLLSISMAAMVILSGISPRHSLAQAAPAQNTVDQDVDLLRKDIRSQKKQIIAANLQLTDSEATKFWPLYDQYTAELVKINDAKYGVIKEYATNYSTLTDDHAIALSNNLLNVDQQVAQLRLKYVPIFNKVIPGKKTALFFQLDRRLVMLIDLQLASQIPMVQP